MEENKQEKVKENWLEEYNHPTKPKLEKSPDLSLLQKIWIPKERAWFYFLKTRSEAFIMERLEKYKHRVITR